MQLHFYLRLESTVPDSALQFIAFHLSSVVTLMGHLGFEWGLSWSRN